MKLETQGGVLYYTEDKLDQVKEALIKFQQNNDTKASMIFSYAYTSGQVRSILSSLCASRTDATDTIGQGRSLDLL